MKKREEEEKEKEKIYPKVRIVWTHTSETDTHHTGIDGLPSPTYEMEMKHTERTNNTYQVVGFGWPWLATLFTTSKAIHGYL